MNFPRETSPSLTLSPMKRAALAGLAIVLAGCSAASPAPSPTVTVTATTTVTASATPKSTTFATLVDLRRGLTDAGISCTRWSTITPDVAGSCDDVILITFSPPADTDRKFMFSAITLSLTAIHSSGQPIALLVGENWFARLRTSDAKFAQKTIGGIILQ